MKSISLPIMFMTDQQEQLDELGIDQEFTDENTDIRIIDFFNINFIYPSQTKKYTIIGCNGDTFCSPKTVKEILNLIELKKNSHEKVKQDLIDLQKKIMNDRINRDQNFHEMLKETK